MSKNVRFLLLELYKYSFLRVIRTTNYPAKFNPVTMVSLFGANMGLWLGLSVIQFLELLVDNVLGRIQ